MNAEQTKTFVAAFLGWTLDAFDFFLVVVLLPELSRAFAAPVPRIAMAVTLTLGLRPLGALLFGWLGDRFGRRIPLMVDVGLYSFLELVTACSPNLTFFLVVRAMFGIAMGGEWGLGAALAMESLPPAARGLYSGLLQVGYPVGNLLAGLALALFAGSIGWRGMFVLGALPALLILYIRGHVPESPAWLASAADRLAVRDDVLLHSMKGSWLLFIYGIVLMTAMNAMAHGSQDPYVTFLSLQRGFSHATAGTLNAIAALGGITGGVFFGWLSQRSGRRWGIVIACLFGSLAMPLWVGGRTLWALALGGFLLQVGVQGAWGIIPAHLNEISPRLVRGTFPGFVYQIGNLIAAPTLQIVTILAASGLALPYGKANYAGAMLLFMGCAFAGVIALTLLGFAVVPERRETALVHGGASS